MMSASFDSPVPGEFASSISIGTSSPAIVNRSNNVRSDATIAAISLASLRSAPITITRNR